jgi:hypothetical protein
MEVTLIKENPDGSADFTFDMTKEEVTAMVQLGILTALQNAIKEAQEKYDPEYDKELDEIVVENSEGSIEEYNKMLGGPD